MWTFDKTNCMTAISKAIKRMVHMITMLAPIVLI